MNSQAFRQALDLAMQLSADERVALAHDLLASLNGQVAADMTPAWEAEIDRRLDELQRGQAQTVEPQEALRRIEASLRRRR